MQRWTSPIRIAGLLAGQGKLLAIVVVAVVFFDIVAILTLTSFRTMGRLHASTNTVEQVLGASELADRVDLLLAEGQSAVQLAAAAEGLAAETGTVRDPLDEIAGARGDLQLAGTRVPAMKPAIDAFLVVARAQEAELRQVQALLAQGQRDVARLRLTAMGDNAGGGALQVARREVNATARASGKVLAAYEAGWIEMAFWIVLVSGLLGCICVLGAFIALKVEFGNWDALRVRLARAQAALMRSERTRTSFIQVVGHDLRQPLQAIDLFATGLERRIDENSSQPLIDGLRSAVASLNRMLSGLMDVSRLDAGAMTVESVAIGVDEVLHAIRAEFEAMALSKGLTLSIAPCALAVYADPVMLESILRNLVSNAVRYTTQGSVLVQCESREDRVMIRVSDTGRGIPQSELGNIFQDFFRVGETGRSGDGLGLGLGIVRRMASLMGAPVNVESVEGQGAVFIVSLPSAALDAATEAALPVTMPEQIAPEVHLAGKHVLLVDDDDAIREALRLEIGARGMLVTVAAAPSEAIAMFKAELGRTGTPGFDIVLMDRDLQSKMTGTELLDHLAVNFGVMLPALVLSGTADFRVIQELQECGYPWLAKPISMPVLLREMQRLTPVLVED